MDAVEVDGKFKYYNEVKQNPNQHYEMLRNLSRNYINSLEDFFLIYNLCLSEKNNDNITLKQNLLRNILFP